MFSFTNFSLVWCVWLTVWLWACQSGFRRYASFTCQDWKLLLGHVIWGVFLHATIISRCFVWTKQNRLIQGPVTLPCVCILSKRWNRSETKYDTAFSPLKGDWSHHSGDMSTGVVASPHGIVGWFLNKHNSNTWASLAWEKNIQEKELLMSVI